MRVRSPVYADTRAAIPCAQCGKSLFSPEWSEYLSACRVRHLWRCTSCDYEFESMVVFPAETSDRRDDAAA